MTSKLHKIHAKSCLFYHSSSHLSPHHFSLYHYKYRKILTISHKTLPFLLKTRCIGVKTTKSFKIHKDLAHETAPEVLSFIVKRVKMLKSLQIPASPLAKETSRKAVGLSVAALRMTIDVGSQCMVRRVTRQNAIARRIQRLSVNFVENSRFLEGDFLDKLACLKDLSLSFLQDEAITTGLAKRIANLRLERLALNIGTAHYRLQESLRLVSRMLEGQNELKSFEFLIGRVHDKENNDLKELEYAMVGLKELKNLNMYCNFGPWNEIKSLMDLVALLEELEVLKLKFDEIMPSEVSGVENLAKGLKKLKDFSLVINNGRRIHNDSFGFLGEIWKGKLRSFSLDIKHTKLSVIAFQHFKEFLIGNPELEGFCLCIGNDGNISGEIFEELAIGFAYCQGIKRLKIELVNCEGLDSEVFYTIGNLLGFLERIEDLELSFGTLVPVKMKHFQEFLDALSEKKGIVNLALHFSTLRLEEEVGIFQIYKALKGLERLERLKLAFSDTFYENQLIAMILRGLKRLSSCKISVFEEGFHSRLKKELRGIERGIFSRLGKFKVESYFV